MREPIQIFDDGVLAEIDLEALHLDLDLARRQALPDLYPAVLGDNVRLSLTQEFCSGRVSAFARSPWLTAESFPLPQE
jgi:hypothetical protein